ncbi:MAG: hypothetical protein PHY02_06450 [Phycisphaerae bacterium]|nr:hypothetical protein [Phycisphaerae bacterium]
MSDSKNVEANEFDMRALDRQTGKIRELRAKLKKAENENKIAWARVHDLEDENSKYFEEIMKERKMSDKEDAYTRLLVFVAEQKRHWRRLKKGLIPEGKIINGWIESCDFAKEDLELLKEIPSEGDKQVIGPEYFKEKEWAKKIDTSIKPSVPTPSCMPQRGVKLE